MYSETIINNPAKEESTKGSNKIYDVVIQGGEEPTDTFQI